MPRSHAQHLDQKEIDTLRNAFRAGHLPPAAAEMVKCSVRIAQKWYAIFRNGGEPPIIASIRKKGAQHEDRLTAPVPKRRCPPPNCIPSLTKERLMAGR